MTRGTKAKSKKAEEKSFEDALGELQTIVGSLESGQVGLAESMEQFTRATGLLKSCYVMLERAEQQINVLTGVTAEGEIETEPFDATATTDQREQPGRRRTTEAPDEADDVSRLF